MTAPALQREPTVHYLAAIERVEEIGRLHDQARLRKSMLVFGPEGVGKTRLLKGFVKTQPFTLSANRTGSPRDACSCRGPRGIGKRELRLPADPRL
jgi:hypothetical protein